MPSGKTHEKLNLLSLHILALAGILSLTYYQYGLEISAYPLLFVIGYWFGTYYLGPDLDLKSSVYYRWKWGRSIWHPYQKRFSHRSVWTHGFLIGDIIRLLYFSLILLIPFSALSIVMKFPLLDIYTFIWNMSSNYLSYIGTCFFGICFASTIHIVSDYSTSWFKKNRKRK